MALPDFPTPTSPSMTKGFYVRSEDIVRTVSSMMKKTIDIGVLAFKREAPHDVPGDWFKGPF